MDKVKMIFEVFNWLLTFYRHLFFDLNTDDTDSTDLH